MKIYFTQHFKHQLKKLMKKYPHAKEDLLKKIEHLDFDHEISIGHHIYKIRIRSTDMKKGASGGFRSYVYAYHQNNILTPLCMYSKGSLESISDRELKYHTDKVLEELLISLSSKESFL